MAAPILTASCLSCKQETPFLITRPTNLYKYDLTGQRFGRLHVNHYVDQLISQSRWCCLCDCGGVARVIGKHLRNKHTQSCGCLWREDMEKRWRKHGMHESLLYNRWEGIKDRCFNPHSSAFMHYGGRGITMCERWQHSFVAFMEDMGHPEPGMEIDRIDNDGPYSPENCRWASRTTQLNNTRRSHRLTYQGETHTIVEWERLLGIHVGTLNARIQRGWDIARALTTPVQQRRSDS